MATHSSILAWRIPWTEEAGGPLGLCCLSMSVTSDWSWVRRVCVALQGLWGGRKGPGSLFLLPFLLFCTGWGGTFLEAGCLGSRFFLPQPSPDINYK